MALFHLEMTILGGPQAAVDYIKAGIPKNQQLLTISRCLIKWEYIQNMKEEHEGWTAIFYIKNNLFWNPASPSVAILVVEICNSQIILSEFYIFMKVSFLSI